LKSEFTWLEKSMWIIEIMAYVTDAFKKSLALRMGRMDFLMHKTKSGIYIFGVRWFEFRPGGLEYNIDFLYYTVKVPNECEKSFCESGILGKFSGFLANSFCAN